MSTQAWIAVGAIGWTLALCLLVMMFHLNRQADQMAQRAVEERKRAGLGEMDTDGE